MRRRGFIKNSLAAAIPFVLPFPFGDLLSSPEKVKNIVLIHLAGGNDGYNTLVPYTSEEYYLKRPSLAIPAKEVIRLSDTHGLNPALISLSDHYNNGEILFVNHVGHAESEHSHYTAAETWNNAFSSRQEEINTEFNEQLAVIARTIGRGEERTYTAGLDGFDTHQFQHTKHDNLLNEYGEGLHSFINDLKKQNTFKDTLIITWSEFGRSLKQNNKKGTDHGNENIMIVAGGSLKARGIINAAENVLLSPSEATSLLTDNYLA